MARVDSRAQVQAGSEREKVLRKQEVAAVRTLMSTPIGRSLMHRLLSFTGADRAIPFSTNAMQLAHDQGVQSVGMFLLSELRASCPELEAVMRNEARERDARLDSQLELDDAR